MKVSIRKFEKSDVPKKVEWINNSDNNKYLHYDLPLEVCKTEKWFDSIKDRDDRYDAVIELDNIPVGLIGLLSIDRKNSKAEYYVTMGDTEQKGKGIAKKASYLILEYAFSKLGLNKVYLYTEYDNVIAQHLFESVGFKKEGLIKNDLFSKGKYVDRYAYGLLREDWNNNDTV